MRTLVFTEIKPIWGIIVCVLFPAIAMWFFGRKDSPPAILKIIVIMGSILAVFVLYRYYVVQEGYPWLPDYYGMQTERVNNYYTYTVFPVEMKLPM